WEEEVLLVVEEMQRVIAYFEWKSQWWHDNTRVRDGVAVDIRHGIMAYAEKQADLLQRMAEGCASQWLSALHVQGFFPEWGPHY
ncbi:hypothetical protein M378DRAFT_47080, partial [Amanita muscaria Koide BX008]